MFGEPPGSINKNLKDGILIKESGKKKISLPDKIQKLA